MPDRKVICYIATSADGYIARLDGDIDWLTTDREHTDYGYAISVDGSGNTYIAGSSTSTAYPVTAGPLGTGGAQVCQGLVVSEQILVR